MFGRTPPDVGQTGDERRTSCLGSRHLEEVASSSALLACVSNTSFRSLWLIMLPTLLSSIAPPIEEYLLVLPPLWWGSPPIWSRLCAGSYRFCGELTAERHEAGGASDNNPVETT